MRACAEKAYAKYVDRIGRPPAPMVADFEAQQATGLIHVLEVDGKPAGYAVFYASDAETLHLEAVAVLPDHAGRGLGRVLMAFVEDRAVAEGHKAVELYTNAAMTENQSFYPRLGYHETGRRIEDGYQRIYFRKELD